MKKSNILLLFVWLGMTLNAQVLVDEEFDGTSGAGKLGVFSLMKYQDEAGWDYKIDDTGFLSGQNSAYMNILNSGTEWWALQVRTDEFPTAKAGDIYYVRFSAASSYATSFIFKAEGVVNYTYNVNLTGDFDVQHFDLRTDPMDSDGNVVFFFALGGSTPCELWFDAVKIEKDNGAGLEELVSEKIQVCAKEKGLVVLNEQSIAYSVKVYDALGKVLVSSPHTTDARLDIPLSERGVYVVSVYDENSTVVKTQKLFVR